jgi:hypothetical protein
LGKYQKQNLCPEKIQGKQQTYRKKIEQEVEQNFEILIQIDLKI